MIERAQVDWLRERRAAAVRAIMLAGPIAFDRTSMCIHCDAQEIARRHVVALGQP